MAKSTRFIGLDVHAETWSAQTIPRSFWAKAFYESCRARGVRHQAALRALAFKWIRILHRCWLDRVPYDESRYLIALQKRGAPLLKHAATRHPHGATESSG